jgi:hypothetical protein
MKVHHFLLLFIIILASYIVGVKYPSTGTMFLSKIGM